VAAQQCVAESYGSRCAHCREHTGTASGGEPDVLGQGHHCRVAGSEHRDRQAVRCVAMAGGEALRPGQVHERVRRQSDPITRRGDDRGHEADAGHDQHDGHGLAAGGRGRRTNGGPILSQLWARCRRSGRHVTGHDRNTAPPWLGTGYIAPCRPPSVDGTSPEQQVSAQRTALRSSGRER
jgi:hypothetical protein